MLQTPYYLIDKARLLPNLEKIAHLREASGAKALLALKCFATWGVFDLMRDYMDGTTSSSLFEVKLGREKFGGETHAYSVAWADHEIAEVLAVSDKVIFNTAGQLRRFEGVRSAASMVGSESVILALGTQYGARSRWRCLVAAMRQCLTALTG